MPIMSNNPVTVDGVTYDRYGVSLAISPAWKDTDIGPSVAMRLERYTKDANGNVLRLQNPTPVEGQPYVDYSASFVYSSLAMVDDNVEEKIRELMTSIQDLINAKGL